MKKNATYAKIVEESSLYKTIKSESSRGKIQLKFYNVSSRNQEILYDFIENAFQQKGTIGFICDSFDNVKLPIFLEHNFITISNKEDIIFIVYGKNE